MNTPQTPVHAALVSGSTALNESDVLSDVDITLILSGQTAKPAAIQAALDRVRTYPSIPPRPFDLTIISFSEAVSDHQAGTPVAWLRHVASQTLFTSDGAPGIWEQPPAALDWRALVATCRLLMTSYDFFSGPSEPEAAHDAVLLAGVLRTLKIAAGRDAPRAADFSLRDPDPRLGLDRSLLPMEAHPFIRTARSVRKGAAFDPEFLDLAKSLHRRLAVFFDADECSQELSKEAQEPVRLRAILARRTRRLIASMRAFVPANIMIFDETHFHHALSLPALEGGDIPLETIRRFHAGAMRLIRETPEDDEEMLMMSLDEMIADLSSTRSGVATVSRI